MFKNYLKISLVLTAAIFLTACSRNPLQKNNKELTAKFLAKASEQAAQTLNLKEDHCYIYRDCMNGTKKGRTCELLYKNMVEYAKATSDYKHLSAHDLTDQSMWQSLQKDYEDVCFTELP